MRHTLLPSVAALLDPATLSQVSGQRVTTVAATPLQAADGKSGSRFETVTTNDGAGPRFVLKRVKLAWDRNMRATDDHHCRAVALWEWGLLDRVPPIIDHATLVCARDDDGWALLLPDVTDTLAPFTAFSVADHAQSVEALAALHATFWEDPELDNPALGLCTLPQTYGMFAPEVGRREVGGDDPLPGRILEGWACVAEILPRDVADAVLALVEDTSPLCAALGRFPRTLIHGDWRHANLGFHHDGSGRVVALDWQLAAAAPPSVELGRALGTNSPLLPVSKDEALAMYRARLADRLGPRLDADGWEAMLQLGLLGGFVQDGWAIVMKATTWQVGEAHRAHWQADLPWWADQIRLGLRWL